MKSFQETTLSDCYMIDIPTFTDERGSITIAEEKQTSFVCKRTFWLHHIKEGKDRGSHALRTSSEIMIAIHGSFIVEINDGEESQDILLNDCTKGFYIPHGIWFRAHTFKDEGLCIVIASSEYKAEEYINNYSDYLILKTI